MKLKALFIIHPPTHRCSGIGFQSWSSCFNIWQCIAVSHIPAWANCRTVSNNLIDSSSLWTEPVSLLIFRRECGVTELVDYYIVPSVLELKPNKFVLAIYIKTALKIGEVITNVEPKFCWTFRWKLIPQPKVCMAFRNDVYLVYWFIHAPCDSSWFPLFSLGISSLHI